MTIHIDAQLCTGCRVCELICSFTKHGAFNPKRARIRIAKTERVFVDIPVVCRQCPEPSCVASCPAEALTQGADQVISLDEASCTGCAACVAACPFAAIAIDPLDATALVCDLCQGDPQCLKWCPTGAIAAGGPERPAPDQAKEGVTAVARSLLQTWGIAWEEYEKYQGQAGDAKVEGGKTQPHE